MFTFLVRHTMRCSTYQATRWKAACYYLRLWCSLQPTKWQHHCSPEPLYSGRSRHKNAVTHCRCCKARLPENCITNSWYRCFGLSVAAMHRLHFEHLWVAFGTGQYFEYIQAHEIAASVGPERAIYICLCSTLKR